MSTDQAPQSGLASFFRAGQAMSYHRGDVIMRGADRSGWVFLIESGHVKVYTITDRGEENLHIMYLAGEFFPVLSTFKPVVRNVFYEALGPSRLWRRRKDDFLDFVKRDTDSAYATLTQVVNQFYVYADRLDNLEYTNAAARLAYRLLLLASRFGRAEGTSIVLDAPITHQDIARSINLARETVSREIEKLEHKGLLASRRHCIVITDIERLAREVGETVNLEAWGLHRP
jgi:CRP/FNR family cyclic AMP-dependent transcriptional regulator